jgi:nucleotide-binding universal stress UspA family protein
MNKISGILLPVDFSERCLGMTHYARSVAEKYDAEVILLHVVNPVFVAPEVGMAPAAVVTTPTWLINEKYKLMDEFATSELAGLRVRRFVYEGIPEAQIEEMAKSGEVQLVMMPTHGYGAFRRFLIGSVTAKVLDDVACPIFTGVHMEKHTHDGKEEFPTITCAVDLKTGSTETLLAAAKLANDFDSKLGIIHVSPPPGKGTVANPADLRPQLEDLVANKLKEKFLNFPVDKLVCCVDSGEIALTICAFAERMGAALLVVGRQHGSEKGSASDGRLAGHTYSIIRQSPCPVLSI